MNAARSLPVSWLPLACLGLVVAACGGGDATRRVADGAGGALDASDGSGGRGAGGASSSGGMPAGGGMSSGGQGGSSAGGSSAGGSSAGGSSAGTPDAGDASSDARADASPADGALADRASPPEAAPAEAGLPSVGSEFPSGLSACGMAYDSIRNRVWVHPCFGAATTSFAPDGSDPVTVDAPGENADDVDVEVVSSALSLGTTTIAAGTLLLVNGETGGAEIHAGGTAGDGGAAVLTTAFGASHVVGGAFHPSRGTFFLVQDRVPGTMAGNRIAEIDPVTGSVLGSFSTLPAFDVNFGDVDVCATTGDLFVVSSNEATIAQLTPTGVLVAEHPLPAGVSTLSGIGIDDATGDMWVCGTNGIVRRLVGLPCTPE